MTVPGPQSSAYRLLVCDLRTDQVLERLHVTGLGFDDYIGKTGSASGTLPVPDVATARRVKESMIPGRTCAYIERGRDIWWGGMAWTRTPQCDDRGRISVPFQAATLDSYFDHRELRATLTATGADQLDIVRDLFDYAQDTEGGDIGIEYDQLLSGVLRDRTYNHYDLPRVRDLVDDLSKVEDGFEWRIMCYRDETGARRRRLQLGYPTITVGSTPLMFSKPGNILSYSFPEDATGRATHWLSRGASIDQNQAADTAPLLSQQFFIIGATDEGWPRLDGSSDHNTVEVQATLDTHAAADLVRAWTQHTIPTIRVRLDGTVTPALIGATARVRIRDDWFYDDGLDAQYRIVGLRVQPPERGQAETAELFLEAV